MRQILRYAMLAMMGTDREELGGNSSLVLFAAPRADQRPGLPTRAQKLAAIFLCKSDLISSSVCHICDKGPGRPQNWFSK